jgi:hypothetical protein
VTGTLQTVHVRVNDAATGKPTPVRIRITDANGPYYPPLGRLREFATGFGEDVGGNVMVGGEAFAYIDGTCEIPLPPGRLTVSIAKGPEYRPVREEVNLPPGKLALRFVIERWADLRAEGWYSGDSHCYFLTPHAALLEAAAEDLAVVNLLAWECFLYNADSDHTYRAIPNLVAFSGQKPALQAPGHLVAVNTLNVHEKLGNLFLLNCHRIVYPLSCGEPEGFDTWRLADWCDQCHRKGGLVIGSGYFSHSLDRPDGELLADLILGKVDTLEMGDFENAAASRERRQESPLREWHQLLDCGFRVPLVGGSGKFDNLRPLGGLRTYALLEPGQPCTYKNWIEAVRAGRTFVTSGPLLNFTVNGQPPGAVLDVPAGAAVRVRAEVRSLRPLARLEILANNRLVAGVDVSDTPAQAVVEAEVSLPQGGWLVARCWGPYDDALEDWHAAQSSPVYVQVEGRRPPADPAAVARFAEQLQQMLRWVAEEARCEDEQQRQRLAAVFQEARATLLGRGHSESHEAAHSESRSLTKCTD